MVAFNKDDLAFILQQIKIGEAHSGLYGTASVPLTDLVVNPLLPYGVRTVDGTFNNIIPGREEWGSADQPFPRLTDPSYRTGTGDPTFDINGPAPGGTGQTANYALVDHDSNPATPMVPLNVVDTAPRTISNLIVDQTLNNPAAIMAALEYAGITGSAATAARNLIIQQHQALAPLTQAAIDAQAAENLAAGQLAIAQGERDIAFAADADAQATVAAYNNAIAAAPAAATSATTAQNAITNFLTLLAVGNPADATDFALLTAAINAASQAATDAAAVLSALQAGPNVTTADLTAAQTNADNAALLVTQLTNLETALINDPNVDPADLTAAGDAAALATNNAVVAGGVAASLSDADSLGQATTDAANAAAVLAIEEGELATAQTNFNNADAASDAADQALATASTTLDATLAANGIVMTPSDSLSGQDSIYLPNVAPDEGISAPFNSWMTLFGQFFDHGLDLVAKTATTKVYIPLQPDDPLYVEGGHSNFMVVTRTTAEAKNLTTPFVDQNQTYTSHASHQVFLREYEGAPGAAVATGHLLEGANGGLATWADVKNEALSKLGLVLDDMHIHEVPLLATDLYGKFEPSPTGFAMVVVSVTISDGTTTQVVDAHATGNATGLDLRNITAADLVGYTPPAGFSITAIAAQGTGHAFLDDIAHNAAPGTLFDDDGNPATPDVVVQADGDADTGNAIGTDDRGRKVAYDDELLDRHFITGDGRGNENIGLTAVHHVFHSEHNRLAEHTKDVTIATGDLAFINEWLDTAIDQAALDVINAIADPVAKDAAIDALDWNGERLFQAARFGTEMQYQHLVFEEFARKVNPMVDLFVFNPTMDINPAIVAEFAHTVYRFGHSMLNETVDRLGADGQTSDDIGLIEAFLNPVEFDKDGAISADVAAGEIVRGMTRQVGNEIDEFVVEALRNNLLGLPLDLATINIARGRETGIPTLQEARAQFYEEARSEWLKPYTSWTDFAQHLKNPASVVNFVAAYGTHGDLLAPEIDTLVEKRAVATAIVLGISVTYVDEDGNTQTAVPPGDRLAFLNATGVYATDPSLGGLNNVDLWIGGLAEAILPFGGMLGPTFTFVFEKQMENLQNGDRFYYLSRTQGLHFLTELENNAFSKIIMKNTDLGADGATHLPGEIFSTPQAILEINQAVQNQPDLVHDDETLQALEPKVARDLHLTVDGNTYDHSLKFTGGEHVVLGGTNDDDVLIGDLGDDTIWGDGGNDYIEGGHGINRLHGGEGDDIIYGGGDPEFLHGDEGNDAINGGNGLGDLIFGGTGHDFVIAGIDGKEVFAAEGNDFVLGTPDVDFLLGGEGDDWIEGGEGFDTIAGENSQLFFNSSIIGHDVMFAGTNEMDFDAESGDDIMVQGESVMRNEGMFGFDWAIFKGMRLDGYADMNIKIFTTVEADILRNRFDRTEALSGWDHNDTLIGDDRVAADAAPDPTLPPNEANLQGDGLDRAGVERIAGLRDVLGLTQAQLEAFAQNEIVFDDGNILLGGAGIDVMQGNGGNDILDGDKWLNVRIGITAVVGGNTVEIGTTDKMQGIVTIYDEFLAQFGNLNGQALDGLVFTRAVNPGQLTIVREILDGADSGADVAVFRGAFSEYTFTEISPGVVQVVHVNPQVLGADDGTDILRNIERVRFLNNTGQVDDAGNPVIVDPTEVSLADILNNVLINDPATADLLISDLTPTNNDLLTPTVANLVDPNGVTIDPTGLDPAATLFTLQWQSSADGTTWTDIAGATATETDPALLSAETFRPRDAEVGLMLRFVLTFTDNEGFLNTIESAPTAPVGDIIRGTNAADANLVGTEGADVIDGRRGADVITVLGGDDIVTGGAGADTVVFRNAITAATFALAGTSLVVTTPLDGTDTLDTVETLRFDGVDFTLRQGTNAGQTINGNGGQDLLLGFNGNDTLNGGALDDVLIGGAGADTLNGGAGADRMIGGADGDTYVVNDAGDVVIEEANEGTDTVGTSLQSYTLGANVENLSVNGGTGDRTFTGNELNNVIISNGGNDTLDGGDGDDTLSGNGGSDTLLGGDGADTLNGGGGADILVGGAGDDTLAGGAAGDTIRIVGNFAFGNDIVNGFDADATGGQDLIELSGLGVNAGNFATRVSIAHFNPAGAADDRAEITIFDTDGSTVLGTLRLNGVNGVGANTVTQTDFLLS